MTVIAHPLHFHTRNARASAGRMPRNEEREIEELPRPRDRGAVHDAAAELSGLPYVRLTQRVPPPRDRRSLWLLVALVVLAHVLLAWLAWWILRPAPYRENQSGVVSVFLIEPSLEPPPPLLPPPPLPGQPAPAAPPPLVHREAQAKGAISATLEGVKTPPLRLYESNGQIRLPSSSAAPQPVPAYSAPGIKGSQIYSGKSPVPYKPTRFNQDWAPDKESLGAKTIGRAVDKAIEKTTVQKTVHLPGGIKIHCAVSPLMLLAGCAGDAPPPPPSNDDDIRLSMPPAESLTGKKVPLPQPASSVAAPASASSASGH
ncbi:MAG: hypothetical protein OJF55_002928 [Rhodanobacteraceae bacterium]|jgi:hypothetical protein|nr:MAG: hypothetical protein OJF55_002928 [Rhodanobacteraceae bacterium]